MYAFQVDTLQSYGRTDDLRPVLEEAIINPFTKQPVPEDIDLTLERLEAALQGKNDMVYAVAHVPQAEALGVMGLRAVGADAAADPMRQYATQPSAAEIVNAYSRTSTRGQGVGRALLTFLEKQAVEQGFTQIVINSGPRYKWSGWPFWDAMYGKPIGMAPDFYGPRVHAKVWRRDLTPQPGCLSS